MPLKFSPQGYTGGPVNMPGLLASGAPATLRSEAVDFERARREMERNPPPSIIGSMINPQQAAMIEAIRRKLLMEQAATGYQPGDATFGSLAPRE